MEFSGVLAAKDPMLSLPWPRFDSWGGISSHWVVLSAGPKPGENGREFGVKPVPNQNLNGPSHSVGIMLGRRRSLNVILSIDSNIP